MSRIIAISTNKGGVLKTSITTNLAGILSKDSKVLIIDSDNQGNASLSFGLQPDDFELSLYNVMVDGMNAKKAIVKAYENVDILPSNDDMSFLEFDILTNMHEYKKPFSLLKSKIKDIESDYDYILIDTPPNLGLTQGNVLSVSHEVLIPFQPESYSMRSLVKMLNAVKNFKEDHNPSMEVLGVVATLVDRRTVLHDEIVQECRKYCYEKGIKMFYAEIPKAIRYASSVAYEGLPATLTAKNNDLVKAYHDLKGEILQ
ncbi:ParA family protein [Virgibacillus sp. CBA3643]|uniref:ParA family protein n=1 Tax=Virgibacillus sp. CBA3643 TaxID=2942278 RepID=UPI0035A3390F